jgi:hypothetical protein
MRVRKKFWLFPMIVVFTVMGTLLVIAQSGTLAPFLYSLF